MTKEYEDIIDLPPHVSRKRPKMSIMNRAAQFAPFAALTGHEAAVKETARQTQEKIQLDQYIKDGLNNKLQIIDDQLKEHPEIEITYFQPDQKKDGGVYTTSIVIVKKIDKYEKLVVMEEGTTIYLDHIIKIEGDIFAEDLPW